MLINLSLNRGKITIKIHTITNIFRFMEVCAAFTPSTVHSEQDNNIRYSRFILQNTEQL